MFTCCPLTVESIEKILQSRADTRLMPYLPTMGGQTALNLCIEAAERGIWEKYGVKVVGVDVAAIEKTENREAFRQLMVDIGVGVATSKIANSFLEGKEAAQEIGYPVGNPPKLYIGW